MDDGMENRSKTVAIVIAILLVVVLVWFLFIRDGGTDPEPAPAPADPAPVVEIDDGQDGTDEGEMAGEDEDGMTDESDEDSETPPGQDTPIVGDEGDEDEAEEVVLPDGWDDFTLAQKLAANPYNCDLDRYPTSMWPDGTCHYPDGADVDDDMSDDMDDDDDMGDDMSDDDMDEVGQS